VTDIQFTVYCDGKNLPEFNVVAMMHGSSLWMLGRKKGSLSTSSVLARGGRVTDVVGRRGVIVVVT
jgi:hypothetical protein